MLSIKGLKAGYGDRIVLKNIDMEFKKGFLVVLGPNGAGKTTLITVVLGLLRPFRGTCIILGRECWENSVKGFRDIAASLEKPPSVRLRIKDYYESLCSFRSCDKDRFYEYLERFGLDKNIVKKSLSKLSAGERMKAYLSAVLSIPSKLYILDEPNSNLDPSSRRKLRDILEDLLREGSSFIVTTHIYEYVEDIATHVAIIHKGELILYSSVEEALEKHVGNSCLVRVRGKKVGDYVGLLEERKTRFKLIEDGTLLIEKCSDVLDQLHSTRDIASIELASLKTLYQSIVRGEEE